MSTLKWVRSVNGTLGWVAPHMVASKMRQAFMTPRTFAPGDWELPLLAKSERITLRFGLSALRWGQGPTVLLMHGWEGRPTQFASLITALVDAGYTVVALDGPAHGRSPGREANVVLFARAMLEAAAELPPLQAVIGHSMGGASAMLAVQLGLRTETLVTIGAPARILAYCAVLPVMYDCHRKPARRSSVRSRKTSACALPPWMSRTINSICRG